MATIDFNALFPSAFTSAVKQPEQRAKPHWCFLYICKLIFIFVKILSISDCAAHKQCRMMYRKNCTKTRKCLKSNTLESLFTKR